MSAKKIAIIVLHALIGWALCAATMYIGMSVTTLENALVIHAVAAPIIFFLVSWVYFNYFRYTSPVETAAIFVSLVIATDFLIVAILINRSLDMFTSALGTWIPFILIFTSTMLTGRFVERRVKSSEKIARV